MKKANIMVPFLMVTMLALIIFIPTCLFTSEMMRVSYQAKENFDDVFATLEGVYNEKVGYMDSVIVILDDQTTFVYFDAGVSEMNVDVKGAGDINDDSYKIVIEKPSVCDDTLNCVCLISNPEIQDNGLINQELRVKPDYMTKCEGINYTIKVASCNIGSPYEVTSYTCNNGFMIERGMAEEEGFDSYYEINRRTGFSVKKLENEVLMSY